MGLLTWKVGKMLRGSRKGYNKRVLHSICIRREMRSFKDERAGNWTYKVMGANTGDYIIIRSRLRTWQAKWDEDVNYGPADITVFVLPPYESSYVTVQTEKNSSGPSGKHHIIEFHVSPEYLKGNSFHTVCPEWKHVEW